MTQQQGAAPNSVLGAVCIKAKISSAYTASAAARGSDPWVLRRSWPVLGTLVHRASAASATAKGLLGLLH